MDDDSCLPSLEEMERIRNRYNKGFDMQTLADIIGIVSSCLESGKLAWVVRCKDCKHVCICDSTEMMPDIPVYAKCTLTDEVHDPDWFCADAEEVEQDGQS